MISLQNITDEAIQRHTILINDEEIVFTLRFYPTVSIWCFDVEWDGGQRYGAKLSLGVLHLVSKNWPFDFAVTDNVSEGIDPFQRNDFSDGRCTIYMLDREDMVGVRNGAEVPT